MTLTLPDPRSEIRVDKLQTLRGPNLWALRPVTRLDISIGCYEHISSADIPGFTARLMAVMPSLVEHRCSVGARGGFLTRLRRGTYAGHIVEHIALELQCLAGHAVGFGKTRSGEGPGEYTLVFEHRHAAVGLRAAQLALEVFQEAIEGSLRTIEHRIVELRSIGADLDLPALVEKVRCAITGGGNTHLVRDLLVRQGLGAGDEIVDVAPSFILEAGLPFARASMAVLLDAEPRGVPERYLRGEHARRLVTVVADVVPARGIVVAPAGEWEVQERVLDGDRRLAVFSPTSIPERSRRVAFACATVSNAEVRIEIAGEPIMNGELEPELPADAQLAAALCAHLAARSEASVAYGNQG